MAYLALGAFVLVVVGFAWVSSRQRQHSTGCCAPADPRDDLRMQAAYEGEGGIHRSDPSNESPEGGP